MSAGSSGPNKRLHDEVDEDELCVGLFGDEIPPVQEHERGEAPSSVESVDGLGDFNEGDELPEQDESELDQTSTTSRQLPSWIFGVGIHPVPPSGANCTGGSAWSLCPTTMHTPRLHLALNIPADFMAPNGNLGQMRNFEQKSLNGRSACFAALFGMMDFTSKGIFFDGMKLIEEEGLPEDEKPRKEAIAQMAPIRAYMYSHLFRGEFDVKTQQQLSDKQFPPNYDRANTHQAKHDAPCVLHYVETLWSLGKATSPGGDDRGPACGYRVHYLFFNPLFAPCKFVNSIMQESNKMHRDGRAIRQFNEKRRVVNERAAKQQRLMVASEDVEKTSTMKFAQIQSNFVMHQVMLSVGNVESSGAARPFYPESTSSLGNGSHLRSIAEHAPGKQHALAPETVFNFRDGARLPRRLEKKIEGDYETDEEEDEEEGEEEFEHTVGRVAVAGMVGTDGVAINIHPLQTDPNNYIGKNGEFKCPFPDSTYLLTNYSVPLRDCTQPCQVDSGPPVGDALLQAFWDVEKESDVMKATELEVLRDIVHRQKMLEEKREPTEDELRECAEELKGLNRPNFNDLKLKLACMFSAKISADFGSDSVMNRRLHNSKMLMNDSLDQVPGESTARAPAVGVDTEANIREVKLATEETANIVNGVLKMVKEACDKRKRSNDPKYHDFLLLANRDALHWGIAMFDATYKDPRNAGSVYPVALEIRRSTLALIAKLPSIGKCAIVDPKNPRRGNGSANIAFIFNRYMDKSKLSAWGNWKAILSKLYGPTISGIQGRNNAIRSALHDAMIAPAGPAGFREMIAIHGVMSMAKSYQTSVFKYLFNREDDKDCKRNWVKSEGGGSARATQAGGLVGGGVVVSDEALRAVASGGQSDPGATEQMQDLKQISTDGQTTRPRCEQRVGPDGKMIYSQVLHVMKVNETRVMCHNLGANICHRGKGAPIVPDTDRQALIDRTVSLLAVDDAQTGVISDDAFKSNVANHPFEINSHTIVVSFTYMCLEMCALVPAWRPSGESDAIRFWSMLDEFMLSEYDIPKPDPRRQTLRRNNALQKAIEHAVVRVFIFKDETVAFNDMLPMSEPFDQSADPDQCVHVLRPWDCSQLANVFQIAVFDAEIVLDAWSCMLDRSLYTAPDMHHILTQFGALHGIKNGDLTQLASHWLRGGNGEEPQRTSPTVVPSIETQHGSSSAADAHRVPTTNHDGLYSPGSDFNDGGSVAPAVSKCQELGSQVVFVPRHETVDSDNSIHKKMAFVRLRRRISSAFTERCSKLTVREFKRHASIADLVRVVFKLGANVRDDTEVTIPTGEVVQFKFVCDTLLPTMNEISNCGYKKEDIVQWVKGLGSATMFTKDDAEGVFLGVPLSSEKWAFQRRPNMSQFTEHVYDCAWRTARTATVPAAPAESEAAAQAPVASAPTSKPTNARSWEANLWSDMKDVAKALPFEIDGIQVFDRIAQVITSTKNRHRKIHVSPDSSDDLEYVSEVAGVGQTSMRLFDKDTEPARVSGMRPDDNKKVVEPITTISATLTRQVLPLHAIAWRNTTGLRELHTKACNRERHNDFAQIGIKCDDLAQCRLDNLLSNRSLPAVNPLFSTVVENAPPIKQERDTVFINSAFFIKEARFGAEIDMFLSSIPGIRCALDNSPAARFVSSSTSTDTVDAGDDMVDATSNELVESNNTSVPVAIQQLARDLFWNGRTTVSDAEIDNCLGNLEFKDANPHEQLVFDKVGIYFTFQAHEQVSWNDTVFFNELSRRFPAVFECGVLNRLPETTTRFFELKSNQRVDIAHGPDFRSTLLSAQKLMKQPARIAKNTTTHRFTPQELVAVQLAHYETNGVKVTDVKELKKLALMLSSTPDVRSVALCNRAQWRTDTTNAKVASGMIHRSSSLNAAIADTGLNLLRAVRIHYAKNPDAVSNNPAIDRAAKYLRPYKVDPIEGTCSSKEREETRVAIMEEISNIVEADQGDMDVETSSSVADIDSTEEMGMIMASDTQEPTL